MRATIKSLEQIFSQICAEAYPNEWDENFISFRLMQELRKLFSNRIIHFNNWSKIVDWQSFKNRGKQETSYGDIALLINIQFSSNEVLKGVVCLEAKREFNSHSFESMDLRQLDSIYANLPFAHLLLYSYHGYELPLKFPNEEEWKSNFWVSSLNTSRQLLRQVERSDNGKVLRTSLPFTMFLTSRVFWGHDLDYRENIYNDITAGNSKLTDPTFLGVVNIYYARQRPIEVSLADIWEEI
jgi:hypothetical protein